MLSENKELIYQKQIAVRKQERPEWKSMKYKRQNLQRKSLKPKFDFTDRNDKNDNPSASIIKTRQKQRERAQL